MTRLTYTLDRTFLLHRQEFVRLTMPPRNILVLNNGPIAIEDDMVDDASDIIPMTGLSVPMPLSTRFINRLAKMTATSVNLAENKKEKSITVYVSRNNGSPQLPIETDKELQEFLQSMKSIAKHPSGM
jgi:hypothetical protein